MATFNIFTMYLIIRSVVYLPSFIIHLTFTIRTEAYIIVMIYQYDINLSHIFGTFVMSVGLVSIIIIHITGRNSDISSMTIREAIALFLKPPQHMLIRHILHCYVHTRDFPAVCLCDIQERLLRMMIFFLAILY